MGQIHKLLMEQLRLDLFLIALFHQDQLLTAPLSMPLSLMGLLHPYKMELLKMELKLTGTFLQEKLLMEKLSIFQC